MRCVAVVVAVVIEYDIVEPIVYVGMRLRCVACVDEMKRLYVSMRVSIVMRRSTACVYECERLTL